MHHVILSVNPHSTHEDTNQQRSQRACRVIVVRSNGHVRRDGRLQSRAENDPVQTATDIGSHVGGSDPGGHDHGWKSLAAAQRHHGDDSC